MGSKAVKFKDNTGNAVYPCPYYPVGSIYMSVNNINPAEFFGGTWEQIKDRFLLACGSTYKNGATGGEATHKLTINEMPSHNHDFFIAIDGGNETVKDKITLDTWGDAKWWHNSHRMDNRGGDQPHNNMPPYLAVYVWKRTK